AGDSRNKRSMIYKIASDVGPGGKLFEIPRTYPLSFRQISTELGPKLQKQISLHLGGKRKLIRTLFQFLKHSLRLLNPSFSSFFQVSQGDQSIGIKFLGQIQWLIQMERACKKGLYFGLHA